MWTTVELESPGSQPMRGHFVDHGYGYNYGDKFSQDGNFAVGAKGPGRPPYNGYKKRTFERPQDRPYQFQRFEDNDYPKYRVERVKQKNLDAQIKHFKNKDFAKFQHKSPSNMNRVSVSVPRKNYAKAAHKNGISRQIDFKVSQAIKKIAEEPNLVNNSMLPLDKPLKTRTWSDSTHLVFDHMIEHEQYVINQNNQNLVYLRRLKYNEESTS